MFASIAVHLCGAGCTDVFPAGADVSGLSVTDRLRIAGRNIYYRVDRLYLLTDSESVARCA